MNVLAAWEDFFFSPESAATIVTFRILFGALLIVNALLLLRNAELWFGEIGVLPLRAYRAGPGRGRMSLFNLLPRGTKSAYGVIAAHLVAAVGLTAGAWTHFSALVAFITLTSLHQRNPMICHSGDCVLRLMCFLLIFSEAGASCSVDSGTFMRPQEFKEVDPWATRLMQIQVAIIYLRAGVGKLRGITWRDGTALYYATGLWDHRRLKLSRQFRSGFVLRVLTWSAVAIEVALPFGLWWAPLRYPLIAMGVALHLGVEVLINVQLFGITMIVCLVLFVSPHDAERVLQLLGVA